MRLNDRPSALAKRRTSRVFAVPGMPVIERSDRLRALREGGETSGDLVWPTIVLRTWVRMAIEHRTELRDELAGLVTSQRTGSRPTS